MISLDIFPVNIFSFLLKQVTYQADLFLDKNKDYVVAEHQDLLIASSDTFVAGLFPRLPEETSSKTKFSSIGSRFKVWYSFCSSYWFFKTAMLYSPLR